MKIIMPEGFTPPPNARPGETFEAVATLKPSDDGGFSIIALDGVRLPEEEEDDEDDDEDDDDEMENESVNERNDSSKIRIPFEEED